jgi:hypothetical protein
VCRAQGGGDGGTGHRYGPGPDAGMGWRPAAGRRSAPGWSRLWPADRTVSGGGALSLGQCREDSTEGCGSGGVSKCVKW